jgi:hypothetical protein
VCAKFSGVKLDLIGRNHVMNSVLSEVIHCKIRRSYAQLRSDSPPPPPISSQFLSSKPSDAPFCIFVLNSFTSLCRHFPISSQRDPQSGLIYIRLGRDSSIHSVHFWLNAMKFTLGDHRILDNSDFLQIYTATWR